MLNVVVAALALVPQPQKLLETGGVSSATNVVYETDRGIAAEGYRLAVTKDRIVIASSDDAGAFYARQTLRQLGEPTPCVEIEDAPAYSWRGFMLDEGRHFFGKEIVKRCLDRMADYKLNVFHWHLTEDQGWRLDIPCFPELVKYGSVRPESVAYGSTGVPWRDKPEKMQTNGQVYGPYFYTASDVREILAYAAERHIRVVPEIELPGHVRALLAAYPEFSCTGAHPRHPAIFHGVHKEVLCAGNDAAIAFLERVFDVVCEMFPDAYVHIGGDECPKDAWKLCEKCQARIRSLDLKDENGLQAWVTRHFTDYLAKKGRRAVGWDEVFAGNPGKNTIIQGWHIQHGNMFGLLAAEAGYQTIVSDRNSTYFSAPQGLSDDPYTYLCPDRSLSLSQSYGFDPYRGMTPAARKNVIGAECCMWSECTWNLYDLEFKLYPRLCAFAEVLWTNPKRRDFADFERRMGIHRRRLVAMGVNCAPLRSAAPAFCGEAAAGGLAFDVDTGNAIHVSRGADEPIAFVVSNRCDLALHVKADIEVSDFWRKSFFIASECDVAPSGVVRLPVCRELRKGHYRAKTVLQTGSGTTTNETSFAVIDRHDPGQKIPYGTFRMGVNYHMNRFYRRRDGSLQKSLDALVAIGAKIVRAGVDTGFCTICPRGPEFDAGRLAAADEMVDMVNARGIALDAFIWGTPEWAKLPEYKGRYDWISAARPGVYRDFCRRLAEHFGTRIEYYEIGNEWDLMPTNGLTVADAIRSIREGYEGVKSASPASLVMPAGWALAMGDHPQVVNAGRRGFQEAVMLGARGFYDVYPMHMHGRFPYFRERMVNAFFRFRKENGLDGVPWFANETALSSSRGKEDLVAETVFKKILWSQAHGSTDYIWYNLIATGPDQNNGEHGYGLMTHDFHPRAGYAAFAALSAAYGGLSRDGILVSRRAREVFRFTGVRNGVKTVAVAGWDDEEPGSREVRFRTDAGRAFAVDLMGNRDELEIRDGIVRWRLTREPSGVLFEGAERVECADASLEQFPAPNADRIDVLAGKPSEHDPDIVLGRPDQVVEFWQADAPKEHRLWRGEGDLSADIRIGRDGDGSVMILAEVRDDSDVPGGNGSVGHDARGDVLRLMLSGKEGPARDIRLFRGDDGSQHATVDGQDCGSSVRAAIRRDGGTTRYEATIPRTTFGMANGDWAFKLNVLLYDDDGEGQDGYLAPTEPDRPGQMIDVRYYLNSQW